MKPETCGEVQQNCTAPAGSSTYTRARCFYCGDPVCPACSQIVRHGRHGRVRLGDDCFIELYGKRGALAVYTKLYRVAGYANPAEAAAKHVASTPDGVDFYRDRVTDQPSTDEYYRLKIQKNALTILRRGRRSKGIELATINDMIREVDVKIGRNRCYPTGSKHSDACDGRCRKGRR